MKAFRCEFGQYSDFITVAVKPDVFLVDYCEHKRNLSFTTGLNPYFEEEGKATSFY